MGLVCKHVLVVLAKFVVGHSSIWFAWSIHFDDDGVLAHVSQPLPAPAPKRQHQFNENLALQRPRVLLTEDTTCIKLPHVLGRYRSFVGGLVQSPGLQVLEKAYKNMIRRHKRPVMRNVGLPGLGWGLQMTIVGSPDVNIGALAVLPSILTSQGRIKLPQVLRQVICGHGLEGHILASIPQVIWKWWNSINNTCIRQSITIIFLLYLKLLSSPLKKCKRERERYPHWHFY